MLLFMLMEFPNASRLSMWVKGHAYLHSRDYTNAINSFKHLEENSALSRNVDILATLGETYYLAGDSKNALIYLQRVRCHLNLKRCSLSLIHRRFSFVVLVFPRFVYNHKYYMRCLTRFMVHSLLTQAHALNYLNLRGTDLLACLLAVEKRNRELEELAMSTTAVTETAPQPWITMGYYCQLSKRTTKAIYFAHKVSKTFLCFNKGDISCYAFILYMSYSFCLLQ